MLFMETHGSPLMYMPKYAPTELCTQRQTIYIHVPATHSYGKQVLHVKCDGEEFGSSIYIRFHNNLESVSK